MSSAMTLVRLSQKNQSRLRAMTNSFTFVCIIVSLSDMGRLLPISARND
jgi:hypothetical protein